jgi:hypothetical protein
VKISRRQWRIDLELASHEGIMGFFAVAGPPAGLAYGLLENYQQTV